MLEPNEGLALAQKMVLGPEPKEGPALALIVEQALAPKAELALVPGAVLVLVPKAGLELGQEEEQGLVPQQGRGQLIGKVLGQVQAQLHEGVIPRMEMVLALVP